MFRAGALLHSLISSIASSSNSLLTLHLQLLKNPTSPSSHKLIPNQLFCRLFVVWPGSVDFRRRTPGPPPFSAMNSTPAFSRARVIAATALSDTWMPPSASALLTVGMERSAADATLVCDQPTRARAARICEGLNKELDPFRSVCMIFLYHSFQFGATR
jgi:hypothetical protein